MIAFNQVSFSYKRKRPLFENLNLDQVQGNIVGLLGKNGAGKSTLLRLMAGLLEPRKGSLNVMGYKPFDRNPNFLADIFMVPEEFVYPSVKMKTFAEANALFYPNYDTAKFQRIANEFEIDINLKFGDVSSGQRKKYLIAFALATNCRLLLLDEPTNALDIPSKRLFRKIVASSITDEQLVFISTHQVKDVENLIDKIIIVDQGQVVFNHNVETICSKLAFQTVLSLTDNSGVLYSQKTIGGFHVISPLNGTETALDIELLFNAVVSGAAIEL